MDIALLRINRMEKIQMQLHPISCFSQIWDDPRITILKKRYFKNKSVLDIGCNAGYLTISLAEQFKPKMILGVDIDGALIVKARNILSMRANEHSESEIVV